MGKTSSLHLKKIKKYVQQYIWVYWMKETGMGWEHSQVFHAMRLWEYQSCLITAESQSEVVSATQGRAPVRKVQGGFWKKKF